jgi:hypothetical protein
MINKTLDQDDSSVAEWQEAGSRVTEWVTLLTGVAGSDRASEQTETAPETRGGKAEARGHLNE